MWLFEGVSTLFEFPWDNPDFAFSAGDRVYLTFEQLQKIKEYVRKLEAVAEAARHLRCGDPDCMGSGFIRIETALEELE